MGGAIGEWSNSAPRAEPCHWATWVAPIFSEGNSLDSQEINTLNPTTKAFGGHFLWHPLAPPCPPPGPRTHCRQIPGTQTPPGGGSRGQRAQFLCSKGFGGFPAPLGPSGPPWPPLAAPGPPWPPTWPPLAPPGPPWPALARHKKECMPVLAAKAEVGIEGASPKP